MEMYHCKFCGRNGTAIGEQVAQFLPVIPQGGGLVDAILYVCAVCGWPVRPGPHKNHKGLNEGGE